LNPFPLPFTGFYAGVSIAGTRVGSTSVAPPGLLPSREARVLELPVDINFMSAGVAVANAVRGGSAPVKLEGKFASGSANLPVELLQQLVFRQ
ncbi:MAG: LEA type 2 family protein, partial [Myxococcales bacterium]